MVGELVKRLVNVVVAILAAVSFFLVPIGSRTLFQHCKAIFSTPEANELGQEIRKTGEQIVTEVKGAPSPAASSSVSKPATKSGAGGNVLPALSGR